MPEGAALPVVGSQPQWWGRLFWEELNAMFKKLGRERCGNELPQHGDFGWTRRDELA